MPALIVIGVLGLGAVIVWVNAVLSRSDIDATLRCTPPPTPPKGTTYNPLGHTALDGQAPMPPDRIAVRVLNASGTRGQAGMTTESLRQLGFTQIADPQNDPAYPGGATANCRGEIRFGDNGVAAARTLSLVTPCVEFVKDNRRDASIDLAVGSTFGDLNANNEARQILQQLSAWSAQHQGSGGGEQSAGASAPTIDPDLISAARDVGC